MRRFGCDSFDDRLVDAPQFLRPTLGVKGVCGVNGTLACLGNVQGSSNTKFSRKAKKRVLNIIQHLHQFSS